MYFFGELVRKKSILFKRILFLLCFGAQSVATTTKTSQSSQSNDASFDPPKYRNAIASGVDRLFASKEVFVKDNMMHLFYKGDKSTIRDDVNFDEVVVCKRVKSDSFSKTYNYIVCPDDAGPRWPSYGQLIRDSSNGNAYCCGLDGWQDCCSKDQLYFQHPNFHPSKRPFDPINVTITREEKPPPEKMKTSTIVIIVCCSIAGLLIIVAIVCLICCLCECCSFFTKSSPSGGKVAGGYATKATGATTGGYRASAAATAYPAGSGGYAGGYAGGYPSNVR